MIGAQERRMPIDPELVKILACPADRGDVVLTPDGTGLKCLTCRRVYPIREDIPVMLVEEAIVEPDAPAQG
jgi:hypothetical protein